MVARAHCLQPGCTWAAEGDPDTVDKAAQQHTKAGHATSTRGVGKC